MHVIDHSIETAKRTKRRIVQNLINIFGWRTDRELVILESDDWGSIRMPSRDVYEDLLRSGDRVDSDPFTRYDSLESEGDLFSLFEVMSRFRDSKGNYPVITANCAVANPDFDKIKAASYGEFHYEPFTETFKRYPEHLRSFELWQRGIKHKLLFPQFHCREHMNVTRWLKDLQDGKPDVLRAFDNRMISTGDSFTQVNKFAYMDALNFDTEQELVSLRATLREGAELFNKIFGFSSKSFIAPCNIWISDLEPELGRNDIKYIQGNHIQFIPQTSEGTTTLGKKRHYIGQANRYNQIYLMRNCMFEPSLSPDFHWIDYCLSQIATAFKWKKPATLCTHRLNFIGFIDESNRENNLKLFSKLLSGIIKNWPKVEFITSVELGELIRESREEEMNER